MKAIFLLLLLPIRSLQADGNAVVERLTDASRRGDLKMAETLLSAGINPDLADSYGQTPLYYAAQFNQAKVIELLLANHANPNAVINKRHGDPFPTTPLQNAAYLGNLRIASLLVAAGAQIDTKGTTGRTALHFAVLGRHLDVMQLLIEKGRRSEYS
jgi:uncharacterized protein